MPGELPGHHGPLHSTQPRSHLRCLSRASHMPGSPGPLLLPGPYLLPTVGSCAGCSCLVAQHCMAWHGTALHGMAQHCMARHGIAQHGIAWHSTVLHGTALHGTARHCMAWDGTALHGTAQLSQGCKEPSAKLQHLRASPHGSSSTSSPWEGGDGGVHARTERARHWGTDRVTGTNLQPHEDLNPCLCPDRQPPRCPPCAMRLLSLLLLLGLCCLLARLVSTGERRAGVGWAWGGHREPVGRC